jgi:hypothetical protein
MWLSLLFGGTAALFLSMTVAALFHLRWAKRLPSLATLTAAASAGTRRQGPVRCSVVVAARDEEARIEDTVRHLLAQRGVEFEVVVVDDRSTDRTSEILRRLAPQDPRLRVQRVEVLPDGWLGKCHACHIGANAATGDWILFTDADCWLKHDVIARALMVAEREQADHITLTPGITTGTLAARAWHLTFLVSLANWISGVNRDRPQAYLGIGAFNLVNRSAYRRCGGYEALRLTVVDDIKLGLLLRRAGMRTRGFIGGDDTACHWGTTLPSMIKIMEKNYFALLDFRLGPALVASLGGTLFWCIAICGPFTGTTAGTAAGVALLSSIVPASIISRELGWSIASAVLTPLVYPVLFYALLNSALVTVGQGGIWWRDTFYALATLRSGAVR